MALRVDYITLDAIGTTPGDVGSIWQDLAGAFKARDSAGVFDLRSGGGGITEAQHKTLRQLIHFLDDGPGDGFGTVPYKEVIGGLFPTKVTWYEDNTKAKRIVEKIIVRVGGGATNVTPTPIIWDIFDTDGSTVLVTATDDITYSGVAEVSRTRTFT